MKFMNEDNHILKGVLDYKAPTAYQLAYRPGIERSPQVIRRRMRKLQKAGYVRSFQPSPTDPICYALSGKMGFEWAAYHLGLDDASQVPFSKKLPNIKSLFFRHMVLCNDTRLIFERATHSHRDFVLHHVIPEWMIDPDYRASSDPFEKFILRQKVAEMGSDKTFSLRPDMVMLHHHTHQGPEKSLCTYVEADRGTETHRQLSKKLPGYRLAFRQQLFQRFGAVKMRVLFVFECKQLKRLQNFQRELQQFAQQLEDPDPPNPAPVGQPFDHELAWKHSASFLWSILMVTRHDLQKAGDEALNDEIYYNWKGQKVPFFKIPRANTAEGMESSSGMVASPTLTLAAISPRINPSFSVPSATLPKEEEQSPTTEPGLESHQSNATDPNEVTKTAVESESPMELVLPVELEEPKSLIPQEIAFPPIPTNTKSSEGAFARSLLGISEEGVPE